MKTLDHAKVIFWLDTQTRKEIDLHKVVPAHLHTEFLSIIDKRDDYEYNGLKVVKKHVKTNIEILDEFFTNFDFPEVHSSSYGYFTKNRLKQFFESFLKCAKSKNQKIPQATKNEAIRTLMRLKAYLSTNAASS
jgi:hypothetical protein